MRNTSTADVCEVVHTNSTLRQPFAESEVRYYSRKMPDRFKRSSGALVWNDEGRVFIDFLSSCGALNYGHNHPTLKARVSEYLSNDGILCSLDLATEAKQRFIEAFGRHILAPRGLDYRLQFTGPTGSNAIEAALKLARKVTGRTTVAAFTNAFHGMSIGALAVTGSRFARRAAGLPLHDTLRLPYEGYHGATVKDLIRFEAMINDPSGGVEAPAAIILEVVQGEGGLNVASVNWLRTLSDMAKRMGSLLIVDEIQTGCGRTGPFFSFERAKLVPDIVCLAKSISGIGLPMALLLMKPEVDIWQPGEHNGTFRGNDLAFVAAAAAAEFWRDPRFLATVERNISTLAAWLERIESLYGDEMFTTCGLGMMVGARFIDPERAQRVLATAYSRGVLLEACGPYDEVVKIMPPLTVDEAVLVEGLSRLEEAIAQEASGCPAFPVAAE